MPIDIESFSECASHSYTPVRRRPSSLPQGYLHNDPEKEWTANRCHRLLRPLKSRISLLEKDLTRSLSSAAVAPRNPRPERANQVWFETEMVGYDDSQASDAEWTQQPARKRVKQTYSSKCTKRGRMNDHGLRACVMSQNPGRKLLAPGEITIPTPMLSRTKRSISLDKSNTSMDWNLQYFNSKRARSRRANSQDCGSYLKLLELRRTTSSNRYSMYEGIYNGLEALLKATSDKPQPQNTTGAKSLLSTCLKLVPQYIADEQEILCDEAEENGGISAFEIRDISSEIYDELEALGSSRKGWKHLRLVVRSHGIHLISNAIQKSLLDGKFCAVLLSLALGMNCQDAAESFLSSGLSLQKIPRPQTAYSHVNDVAANGPMSLLWGFISHKKMPTYQYRQITKMLSNSMLPVEWLATKGIGQIWTSAIQALSSSSSYDINATEFVQVALTILGQPDTSCDESNSRENHSKLITSLQQTYSSVLTTLSTIAILSKDTAQRRHDIGSGNSSITEYDNVTQILQNCLAERSLVFLSTRRALLLLASILIEFSEDIKYTHVSHINSLVEILVRERRGSGEPYAYQALVGFICSIACCCARGTSTATLEHMRGLHHTLDHLASSSTISEAVIVFELIMDSAFAFSEQDPVRKHLDYAASIELKYDNVEVEPRNISGQNTGQMGGGGFRWEEGISEWVTATPGINTGKYSQITDYSGADAAICDTPMRLRPYETRKKNADVSKNLKGSHTTPSLPEKEEGDKEQPVIDTSPITNQEYLLQSPASEIEGDAIAQAPEIGRRGMKRKKHSPVRHVQILQDESDDELSFLSCTSADDRSLRVVTNMAHSRRQTRHGSRKSAKQRVATGSMAILGDDSEDELCI